MIKRLITVLLALLIIPTNAFAAGNWGQDLSEKYQCVVELYQQVATQVETVRRTGISPATASRHLKFATDSEQLSKLTKNLKVNIPDEISDEERALANDFLTKMDETLDIQITVCSNLQQYIITKEGNFLENTLNANTELGNKIQEMLIAGQKFTVYKQNQNKAK